jgi:uncharacterized protein (DUF4213/DUF364 family)
VSYNQVVQCLRNLEARMLMARMDSINVNGARALNPELNRILATADAAKIQSKAR